MLGLNPLGLILLFVESVPPIDDFLVLGLHSFGLLGPDVTRASFVPTEAGPEHELHPSLQRRRRQCLLYACFERRQTRRFPRTEPTMTEVSSLQTTFFQS